MVMDVVRGALLFDELDQTGCPIIKAKIYKCVELCIEGNAALNNFDLFNV